MRKSPDYPTDEQIAARTKMLANAVPPSKPYNSVIPPVIREVTVNLLCDKQDEVEQEPE